MAPIHCLYTLSLPESSRLIFFKFKIRFYYVVLAGLELKKCRSSQALTCSNPLASAPDCPWDDRHATSHLALPVISAARPDHLCISSYDTCGGRPIGSLLSSEGGVTGIWGGAIFVGCRGFSQSETRLFPALASVPCVGKALMEEDLAVTVSAAPAA